MKIINQSHEIIYPVPVMGVDPNLGLKMAFEQEAKLIELAGRTAYKSEDQISVNSWFSFCEKMVRNHHEAVIEFGSMMVKFVTDRGVTHELVRHRLCSFLQESTRYCNYGKDKFDNQITVIRPSNLSEAEEQEWSTAMEVSEWRYLELLRLGATPQKARSVLPNSLKTEIVVRTNFREWRHIFNLRAISKAAHPDMRNMMIPLYQQCRELLPCVFDMGAPE